MNRRFFKGVLTRYRDMVYTHARYYTGNGDDAADITQEVFMKLWTHGDTVDKTTLKAWLMAVTRNRCIDDRRRNRRSPILHLLHDENSPDLVELTPDTRPDPEHLVIRQSSRDRLHECISQLPPQMKSVLILREIQQCTYLEIAEILAMPLDNVKVTLHRARKKLYDMVRCEFAADRMEPDHV